MNGTTPVVKEEAHGYESLQRVEEIIVKIYIYGLPAVILLGLLGNTLSFIVFAASHLRHQSSSVYLAFLNFADCLFLICLLISQLDWYSIYLMRIDGVCQLVIYFSYVGAFLSVWTVVSFTVERFIVVYFPLMRLVHCTRKRAILITCSLLGTSLVLYNFSLWTTKVYRYETHRDCRYIEEYNKALQILSVVDSFVTMVIPTLVVIGFNISIIARVWYVLRQKDDPEQEEGSAVSPDHVQERPGSRARGIPLIKVVGRSRGESTSSSGSSRVSGYDVRSPCCTLCSTRSRDGATYQRTNLRSSTTSSGSGRSQRPSIRRHTSRSQALQLRTTRTLLIISSLFIILNLPSHAIRVWITFDPSLTSQTSRLVQLSFQFLYYLNFCSNFVLYSACSKSFRKELRVMLQKIWRKLRACCGCYRYQTTF